MGNGTSERYTGKKEVKNLKQGHSKHPQSRKKQERNTSKAKKGHKI